MKISVICTVLNEGDNVSKLLDSILGQTRVPDEIVVVDGGSRDGTYEAIKKYSHKNKIIRVFEEPGNIAHGRNFAIEKAKHEIIVQIDAGCVAHPKWIERIVSPFSSKEVGLAAGFYIMECKSPLQCAVAPYHGITPRKFDPRVFLPSGRSMAFRKSTWEKVGGYSENLQWAGEDTLFNYKIVKAGIKIARVPEAYVYWEPPKTFPETIKKFYKYAIGDAQTGIWWHPGKNLATHNIKILSIFARYLLAFAILSLTLLNPIFTYILLMYLILYAFWSIWKHIEDVEDTASRLLIPIVQFTSDFAVMAGFTVGSIKRR